MPRPEGPDVEADDDVDEKSRGRIRPALENRKARLTHTIPASVVFELRRKGIHIVGAIVAVPVLLLIPLTYATVLALVAVGVIGGTYLLAERGHEPENVAHRALHARVNGLLESTRREGEGFPWASTLFLTSLVLIAWAVELTATPLSIAFAAYGILGMGDAGSALIGVAYGRTPIPWNRRKSVQGTLAGIVAAFLAGVLLALVFYAWEGLPFPVSLFLVVGAGALAGMLIETLPGVQDNLTVPIGALAAMVAVGRVLGVL